MAMPAQKPHRSKQDYATPRPFLTALKRRLRIDDFCFDFAASPDNAVVPQYWSEADDSLDKSLDEWIEKCGHLRDQEPRWGWLNPPFEKIEPWAWYCSHVRERAGSIAFLVPASVGANWFRDEVDGKALILMLNGRLAFMPDRPTWLYPKDCICCLYSPRIVPGYEVWNWRE